MNRRVALALAAALVLAGCSGSDQPAPTSDGSGGTGSATSAPMDETPTESLPHVPPLDATAVQQAAQAINPAAKTRIDDGQPLAKDVPASSSIVVSLPPHSQVVAFAKELAPKISVPQDRVAKLLVSDAKETAAEASPLQGNHVIAISDVTRPLPELYAGLAGLEQGLPTWATGFGIRVKGKSPAGTKETAVAIAQVCADQPSHAADAMRLLDAKVPAGFPVRKAVCTPNGPLVTLLPPGNGTPGYTTIEVTPEKWWSEAEMARAKTILDAVAPKPKDGKPLFIQTMESNFTYRVGDKVLHDYAAPFQSPERDMLLKVWGVTKVDRPRPVDTPAPTAGPSATAPAGASPTAMATTPADPVTPTPPAPAKH